MGGIPQRPGIWSLLNQQVNEPNSPGRSVLCQDEPGESRGGTKSRLGDALVLGT